MRTLTLPFSAVVFFTLLSNLHAAPIFSLGFDELKPGEDVLNYYNRGFGSLGTGPGPSLGVIFGPGWIASPPDAFPDNRGNSVTISGTATVNIPVGWSGLTSFYYTSSSGLKVSFYDQVNGGGNLVRTFYLPSLEQPCTLNVGMFCPVGGDLPFFRSAVFQTSASGRLDDLTTGFLVVPEPAALECVLLGIAVLGLSALRHNPRLATPRLQ